MFVVMPNLPDNPVGTNTLSGLRKIAQDMIVEEARRRPSARQVAERLDVILHELP